MSKADLRRLDDERRVRALTSDHAPMIARAFMELYKERQRKKTALTYTWRPWDQMTPEQHALIAGRCPPGKLGEELLLQSMEGQRRHTKFRDEIWITFMSLADGRNVSVPIEKAVQILCDQFGKDIDACILAAGMSLSEGFGGSTLKIEREAFEAAKVEVESRTDASWGEF